jgi:hypothetical protein
MHEGICEEDCGGTGGKRDGYSTKIYLWEGLSEVNRLEY